MSTMISEVYEALISAGADESKAKKAAEVLSNEQLATKQDLLNTEKRLERRLDWMIGFVIVAGGASFGYIFSLLNTVISNS